MLNKGICIIIVLISVFALGCKKYKGAPSAPIKLPTREELTKDSIFLYAKEIYYWFDALPDYQTFMPGAKANPDSTVSAISRYKLNPKFNLNDPYNRNRYLDKYSFLDDGGLATELGGIGGDFGFSIFYNDANDLRVKYVYENSPAALNGLKRGYQITKLNGRTDLNYNTAGSVDFVVNAILSSSSSSLTMTVKANDGTTSDISFTKGTYAINPVIYKNVYSAGSKKVGYLVFNRFTTNAVTKLDEAFSYFATNNINELIVDLRYNGGGSVETAENIANYIVPSSQNGRVMSRTYFNQMMQSGTATILKNQKLRYNGQLVSLFDFDFTASGNTTNFTKKGSLNLRRVYFLVTGSTASASELLINSLKPTIDVKTIGRRTYGKPVGFFGVRIDKFDLYLAQFQTKNQLDEGDYFDGLPVDKDIFDDVTKDFGDPTEKLLQQALNYATLGTFSSIDKGVTLKGSASMSDAKAAELTSELDRNEFKGMIKSMLTGR